MISDFFHIGGTMDEDAKSYVERPADEKLISLVEKNEICLVLAPRQTGKSSLMAHALSPLQKRNIVPAIVDLQSIGTQKNMELWYRDVVDKIERFLNLKTNAMKWWNREDAPGPTQRFINFLEDVVLAEIPENIVIFFDEIDSILSLPFSDDFFTSIRSIYNARATNPKLKRLTFVLMGVATPSEFIKNPTRTPFNVGKIIELSDFEKEKLGPFYEVLGDNSDNLIDRIFYWTGGQPLLLQNLTSTICSWEQKERAIEKIDAEVSNSYLKVKLDSQEYSEEKRHLSFINDYILQKSPLPNKTLKTYKKVLKGKEIIYDVKDSCHTILKLSGVIKVLNGQIKPRNQIYKKIFDQKWIKTNTVHDNNIYKRIAYVSSTILIGVLLWFLLAKPLFCPNITCGKF